MADKPEIKIGADLSQAGKAVDDFGKKVEDAAKPLEAKIDTAAAEKNLEDLAAKAKEAADAAAMPAAAAGVKKLADELERARKIQEVLAREGVKVSRDQANAARAQYERWRASGARGTRKLQGQSLDQFLDKGWRDTAIDETDARRTRSQVLKAVGLHPGKDEKGFSAFLARALGQAGHGVAGALPSSGVGGSIMRSSVADAAGAGGLFSGAGMARLAAGAGIGALAYGAVKLVGGIAGGASSAADEGTARSDLVRSVGGTVEDFDRLRESAQALAHGLSITAGEATAAARAYAEGSGTTQADSDRIYGEAGRAGGIARGTGMNVGSTVAQFAELRRTGQEAPEKLGKTIADAISKRGDFGRLSEVLSNLTSFSSGVAGGSLTRGNTDNILDIAGRLASLKLPGLGSAEGVGHMAAMDAGFRGGAGGQAGDLMVLQGLQRMNTNASGYDVRTVRESGLLANLSDVFGRNSPGYRAASARGDKSEMGRLDSLAGSGHGTVLDMVYRGLQGRYGSNTKELESALSEITGGSDGDAKALIAAMSGKGTSGIVDKLKGMGLYRSDMSVQQMVAANGAMSMSPDQLHSRRDELLARTGAARLSDSDRTRLAGAHTDDDLRKTLTDIASKETIKTEGEKTRQTMADLKQAVENIGQLLVVPLNAIREAVVGVAKFFGVIDQDKADQLMGKPEAEVLSRKRDELDKRIAAERAKPAIGGPGQAGMRRNDALLGSLEKQRAEFDEGIQGDEQAHPDTAYAQAARREAGARNQQVAKLAASPSQFDDLFDAAAQKYGVRSSDLKLLAAREAGMNPGARHVNSDGSVDLGIMQHNSKYLAQRGLTADDAMDPSKAIPEGAKLWAQLLKESGGDRHEAFRRYNGGARHLPSSDAYANDQMASSAMVDAANDAKRTAGADSRLPGKTVAARAAAGMERGATVQHAHNLNVTLTDPLTGRTTTYPAIPLHDGNPTPNGSGVSADQEWWRPVAS